MVTHSLKKMKQEDRDIALNPMQFRKAGSADFIDIRTLDETDEEVFNSIFYDAKHHQADKKNKFAIVQKK